MRDDPVHVLCGLPRRLVLTLGNQRWWVDPDPHPDGTVVIEEQADGGAVRGRVLTGRELPAPDDVQAYIRHELTCPESREARRRAAARAPKCQGCGEPMHPDLTSEHDGYHPCCAPPISLGEAVARARQAITTRTTNDTRRTA